MDNFKCIRLGPASVALTLSLTPLGTIDFAKWTTPKRSETTSNQPLARQSRLLCQERHRIASSTSRPFTSRLPSSGGALPFINQQLTRNNRHDHSLHRIWPQHCVLVAHYHLSLRQLTLMSSQVPIVNRSWTTAKRSNNVFTSAFSALMSTDVALLTHIGALIHGLCSACHGNGHFLLVHVHLVRSSAKCPRSSANRVVCANFGMCDSFMNCVTEMCANFLSHLTLNNQPLTPKPQQCVTGVPAFQTLFQNKHLPKIKWLRNELKKPVTLAHKSISPDTYHLTAKKSDTQSGTHRQKPVTHT